MGEATERLTPKDLFGERFSGSWYEADRESPRFIRVSDADVLRRAAEIVEERFVAHPLPCYTLLSLIYERVNLDAVVPAFLRQMADDSDQGSTDQ